VTEIFTKIKNRVKLYTINIKEFFMSNYDVIIIGAGNGGMKTTLTIVKAGDRIDAWVQWLHEKVKEWNS
jgi:hypothetical protein